MSTRILIVLTCLFMTTIGFAQWTKDVRISTGLTQNSIKTLYGYDQIQHQIVLTDKGVFKYSTSLERIGQETTPCIQHAKYIQSNYTDSWYLYSNKIVQFRSGTVGGGTLFNAGTIQLAGGGSLNTGTLKGITYALDKIIVATNGGIISVTGNSANLSFARLSTKNAGALSKLDDNTAIFAVNNQIFKLTASGESIYVQLPLGKIVYEFVHFNSRVYARTSVAQNYFNAEFYDITGGTLQLLTQKIHGLHFIHVDNKILPITFVSPIFGDMFYPSRSNYYVGVLEEVNGQQVGQLYSRASTWPVPVVDYQSIMNSGVSGVFSYALNGASPQKVKITDGYIKKEGAATFVYYLADYDLRRGPGRNAVLLKLTLPSTSPGTYNIGVNGCSAVFEQNGRQTLANRGRGTITLIAEGKGNFNIQADNIVLEGKFLNLKIQ